MQLKIICQLIVKSIKDSGVLVKGVTKTIHNDMSEQKGGFLPMLLGTLGSSLLGDLLIKNLSGKGFVRAGEGTLTNFEMQEYYESEPRFNGVYSRDNLPKTIKDGTYVINLDEYADVGTHWIALYVKNNEIISILLV